MYLHDLSACPSEASHGPPADLVKSPIGIACPLWCWLVHQVSFAAGQWRESQSPCAAAAIPHETNLPKIWGPGTGVFGCVGINPRILRVLLQKPFRSEKRPMRFTKQLNQIL